MPGGVAQVQEASLGQHDHRVAVGEHELVHLGLDGDPLDVRHPLQPGHIDLVVEVADVAHDGLVLHPAHVLGGDDAATAGGRDEEVGPVQHPLQGVDLVSLHGGLKGADGIDLGDDHSCSLAAKRLGAALAYVAEAAHHSCLAADHHVGGPVDAVDERVAAAVEVVELGLGDGVVDVDGREQQLAGLQHLVQPVDAGGGLLRHAPDSPSDAGPPLRVGGQGLGEGGQHDLPLLGVVVAGRRHGARRLELGPLVDQQGGVATVVQDQVGSLAVWPLKNLAGGPPVLLQRLALPGEHGYAP